MPEVLIYIAVAAFGASIGSFLNVCIHRIPLKESVVSPGSRCPSCKEPIRSYDNIPVISYLLLLGRCRNCGVRISAEYPMVEALTAFFAVALYARFGLSPDFFVYALLVSSLLVITFIDLHLRIIPDLISLPGIPVGFACSFFLVEPGVVNSLIGIVAGGGGLLAVALCYLWATGKDGMGGGDIKLMAMLGAFLGWKGVLLTIFIGSFAGAVIGGGLMLFFGKSSKYAVPFGPFLALGAVVHLFFGEEIIRMYLSGAWRL
ncbi:MAG: prepilin peptidase [Thermodesulfobacteriota bacterium]